MAHDVSPVRAAVGGGRAVVMVGFMGAGKTTAAAGAAAALGAEAVDTDEVIAQRLGKPIPKIFTQDGEPAFREAEERITLELLAQGQAGRPQVLSLGGGALGSPRVREALSRHLVVWLDIDGRRRSATCWRRWRVWTGQSTVSRCYGRPAPRATTPPTSGRAC
jgi:shikimate kinase/3-dehydroquinate synthase